MSGGWMVVHDSKVKIHLALGHRGRRSYERVVLEGLTMLEAYREADKLNLIEEVDES